MYCFVVAAVTVSGRLYHVYLYCEVLIQKRDFIASNTVNAHEPTWPEVFVVFSSEYCPDNTVFCLLPCGSKKT